MNQASEQTQPVVAEPVIAEPAIAEQSTAEEAADESTQDTVARIIEEKTREETKEESVLDKEQPIDTPLHQGKFNGYTNEAKQLLSTLSPEIQKLIDDRESNYHKGQEKYKEAADYGNTFRKVIAPHQEYFDQIGTTADQIIPNLLSVERQLRTADIQTKAELFQKLAYEYGVNLAGVAQLPFDPQMHQLQGERNQLQNELQKIQALQQEQEEQQILSEIDEFSQTPGHEYFEDVKQDMAALLDKGLANGLDDAYTMAVERLTGIYKKHNPAQDFIQQNNAAKAAKRTAVSVKGAPTGTLNDATYNTTEDAVRAAFLRHGVPI